MRWQEVVGMVDQFYNHQDSQNPKYAGNRTKQWLAYLQRQYKDAGRLFDSLKRLRAVEDIAECLYLHRKSLDLQAF